MAFENKRGVIEQCLLLLLLFMGFAARIYPLNAVAINPDEQRVLHQTLYKPFVNVLSITTLHYFPEHTFANILIWLSHKLGWQPFLLRWPAVLFGVLTLALLYRFTKKNTRSIPCFGCHFFAGFFNLSFG
jgi:hypothetical protein